MIGPHTALEKFIFQAFNITGRATRAEYWWVFGALFILGIFALMADIYAVMTAEYVNYNPLAYFTPVLILLTIIPNFTLTARRLHDTGRSSMWYMVSMIPFVGPIWLFVILVLPSQQDENKWGQPPHGSFGAGPSQKSAGGSEASASKPHDPRQGYAALLKLNREPSPEEVAAQRDQINDYYRTHVLGRASA